MNDPIVAAIESNLADYWLAMGHNPKGEIHDTETLRWEYSGGPYFNRVVSSGLNPTDAEKGIEEIVREFAARRAAITWLVGPSATPSDLGERLTQHGFNQHEVWKGMARELDNLDEPPVPLPDVEIKLVEDEATRRDWIDVIARSYQLPPDAQTVLLESVISAEQSTPAAWSHNIAYFEGAPVAASSLFASGETAGIYLVATVPEARGKGLGTVVTWKAMTEAKGLGCKLAVLQSTEQAQRVYKKLGFKTYCDISVYRRPAPGTMWRRVARAGVRWLRRRQDQKSRGSLWGKREDPELSPGETGQSIAM